MGTRVTAKRAGLLDDEEAFLWATISLGEARQSGKRRSTALLEVVVAELAFDLGAGNFPPKGARAMSAISERSNEAHPSR